MLPLHTETAPFIKNCPMLVQSTTTSPVSVHWVLLLRHKDAITDLVGVSATTVDKRTSLGYIHTQAAVPVSQTLIWIFSKEIQMSVIAGGGGIPTLCGFPYVSCSAIYSSLPQISIPRLCLEA
jgi:hypothetical protein